MDLRSNSTCRQPKLIVLSDRRVRSSRSPERRGNIRKAAPNREPLRSPLKFSLCAALTSLVSLLSSEAVDVRLRSVMAVVTNINIMGTALLSLRASSRPSTGHSHGPEIPFGSSIDQVGGVSEVNLLNAFRDGNVILFLACVDGHSKAIVI